MGAARGSAEHRGARRDRAARARSREARRPGDALQLAGVVGPRRAPQERALSQDRAPVRGRPRPRRAGRPCLRGGARRLAARHRRGQRAGAALPAARRLPQPGRAATAQGRHRRCARSEEGALLQGGPALRRGAGERRQGDRRLSPGHGRRRLRSGGARPPGAALHPPQPLVRSQGRLRQEGRARAEPAGKEADAVRARAGLRPRARRQAARDRDLYVDRRSRSG